MKQLLLMTVISFIFLGCKNEIDTTPPKPPQGIITVSLDGMVEIQWLPSQADDVKGYNVWVGNSYGGSYQLIGSTDQLTFIDYGAVNGVTYYYAVSAFDFSNNESELSKDVVYDTPRPEGSGVILRDIVTSPGASGYSFATYSVLSYNNPLTDFYFVNESGKLYLEVPINADIQDMGYTSTLDEISRAPLQGWSDWGNAEALPGHTYVFYTADNNYAKVRLTAVSSTQIVFQWAYQTAINNTELKASRIPISENTQAMRHKNK